MGMRMPGWYDIADFGDLANRSEDEAGILRSQKVFHTLIEDEIKAGIPTERIVLGGFSQGGAMSLMAGITNPTKLGGIFGLSCYLLLQGKIRDLVPQDSPNQKTPIFMGHGDADPVVKYAWGKATAESLKSWGWEVDLRTYKGLEHSAAPEEIVDLAQYLQQRIPDLGDKPLGGSGSL
jgi:predicted esterase